MEELYTKTKEELIEELNKLKGENILVRECEMLYKEILDSSLVACYKRNLRDNTYEYLSPVFTQITGYRPEEMKSMPIESVIELIHPDDLSDVIKIVNDIQEVSESFSYKIEYRFKHKENGEYYWLCDKFTVTMSSDGFPEGLIGSITEITERKIFRNKLQESNTRLKDIFNSLQDAYFETDLNGIFTVISPSATILYGYSDIKELIGMEAVRLYVNPTDRAELMSLLSKNGSVMDFIFMALRKDNSTFWASINAQFKYDDRGVFSGLIGVVRDITERKNRENELQKKIKNLEWHYEVAVQRELKMVKLKEEINELLEKFGFDKRYLI